MVSMWFKHEANLTVMVDLLKVMKEELGTAAYEINGQRVKARLEVSLQRRPLTKAQAMFFNGLKEMDGDESKVRTFLLETPDLFLCRRGSCCKMHTRGRRSRFQRRSLWDGGEVEPTHDQNDWVVAQRRGVRLAAGFS